MRGGGNGESESDDLRSTTCVSALVTPCARPQDGQAQCSPSRDVSTFV